MYPSWQINPPQDIPNPLPGVARRETYEYDKHGSSIKTVIDIYDADGRLVSRETSRPGGGD
jgi:hypothetical protein